jgi:hypothetical protein
MAAAGLLPGRTTRCGPDAAPSEAAHESPSPPDGRRRLARTAGGGAEWTRVAAVARARTCFCHNLPIIESMTADKDWRAGQAPAGLWARQTAANRGGVCLLAAPFRRSRLEAGEDVRATRCERQ